MNKKIETDTIEIKISNQDFGLKSLRRFQMGEAFDGYFENQWRGV